MAALPAVPVEPPMPVPTAPPSPIPTEAPVPLPIPTAPAGVPLPPLPVDPPVPSPVPTPPVDLPTPVTPPGPPLDVPIPAPVSTRPASAPLPSLPIDPSIPVPVPTAPAPVPPPALPIDPSVPVPVPTSPPVGSPIPLPPPPSLPIDPSIPGPVPLPPVTVPLLAPVPSLPTDVTGPVTAPNPIDPANPVNPITGPAVAPGPKPSSPKPRAQGGSISPQSQPGEPKQTHTSPRDNHKSTVHKTSHAPGQTSRSGRSISPVNGLNNGTAGQPVPPQSSGGPLGGVIATGEGLFDPTAFPDSIFAILAALAALLAVTYWLREQRRKDGRLLLPDAALQRLATKSSVNGGVGLHSENGGLRRSEGGTNGWSPAGSASTRNGSPGQANGYSPTSNGAKAPATLAAAVATAVRTPSDKPGNGLPANGSALAGTVPLVSGRDRVARAKREAPTQARVSVVIPAKNEEKSLPYVLRRLPPWLHEVIVVDGLSEDATSEVARLCLPSVRVVSQSGRGKGNALREGFVHCTGDIVVALDADGSMDPGEIPAIVAFLESGFDYVKGSRMIGGGSSIDLTSFRRFGNWMFRSLTNFFHGTSYTDLCYGYFGFRRGTIDRLDLRSSGVEIETEISIKAHHAGLRTAEIPSSQSARHDGASNLSAIRDGWRILGTIFRAAVEDSIPTRSHLGAASASPTRLLESPAHDRRRAYS